jgi:hypothetical protein
MQLVKRPGCARGLGTIWIGSLVLVVACNARDEYREGAALSGRESMRECADKTLAALRGAESIEVLSLAHPHSTCEFAEEAPFLWYRVLKRTRVTCPNLREELISALQSGFDEADGYRHMTIGDREYGLEAVLADGQTMQMKFNFTNKSVWVEFDGQNGCAYSTMPDAKILFESILTDTGVRW